MRKATMNKNAAVVNLILVTIVVATTIEANIMKSLLALMHKMWLDIADEVINDWIARNKELGVEISIRENDSFVSYAQIEQNNTRKCKK